MSFFADDSPSAAKGRFMQRFSYSGHESVCVVLAAHLLLQTQPDLEAIRDILAKEVKHESDKAKYLEIMLEVFSAFSYLFLRQQLANCRRTITPVNNLHLARENLALRSMPFWLRIQVHLSSRRCLRGKSKVQEH